MKNIKLFNLILILSFSQTLAVLNLFCFFDANASERNRRISAESKYNEINAKAGVDLREGLTPEGETIAELIQRLDSEKNAAIENLSAPENISYDAVIEEPIASLYPLPEIGVLYNSKCFRFIEESGEIGDFGKKILKAIEDVDPKCFYNDIDISSLCPSFDSFVQKQKEHFWVWAFASIAQKESSCIKTTKVWGVHDFAVGYFQLEDSKSRRRTSERDQKFCRTDKAVDSFNDEFQAECAVSILRDQHCSVNIPVPSSDSYWQRFRTQNGAISKLINAYPGCK